jgi:hypothetical protein
MFNIKSFLVPFAYNFNGFKIKKAMPPGMALQCNDNNSTNLLTKKGQQVKKQ